MTTSITAHKTRQGGFVMTSELVLLVTTMVVGLTVGLVTMRDALTAEMEDVAEAIGSLDQTYAFNGLVNGESTAAVEGSVYGDAPDVIAGDNTEFTFVTATALEGGATAASLGASSAAVAGTLTAP
ncbi:MULTISPECIES: hypothetical protein [unclassified Oceanobacter]|jgi:hypothetical protein|uniref:hypothetical protein n=1 Tax=unclassified Oceanobacter TaxID=2620260 RepID=UPI0026E45F3D|nr:MULTISPECIES: hypothetical protein [unclassified Oceanobacter]MDO6681478.1 hypothetical protein [Oceanobacter sp. 5_MG-2023]MDP2506685.1 hypothetical protein [Oceanobacter sp. 3_MG-2023]MDP2548760.1 hypothetical protein [Oceanobacter sp. 4_MG-2023]